MKNLQKKLSFVLCIVLMVSSLSSCGFFFSTKEHKNDKVSQSEKIETMEDTEGIGTTELDSIEMNTTEGDDEENAASNVVESDSPGKNNTETTDSSAQGNDGSENSSKQDVQSDNSGGNSSKNHQNTNQGNSNQGSAGSQSQGATTDEQMARNIVNQIISPGMSDFEKAFAIHDWLIFNVDYDYTYSNYDVESTLKTKKAVCQGYALSFEMMAEMAGLEAAFIGGTANNGDGSGYQSHAWNRVKINGTWYNVDTTWDDPGFSGKNPSDHSANRYDYFLISDAQLNKDHSASQIPGDCGSCSQNYDRLTILKTAANSGRYGDVAVVTSISEANAGIKKYMNQNKSSMNLWIYDSSLTVSTAGAYIQNLVGKVQYVITVGSYYPSDNGVIKCPIGITPSSEWNAIPVVTNVEGFKALLDQKGDAGITSYTVRYESANGQPEIAASRYGCGVSYVTYNDGNSWLINVTIQ